MFTWDKIVELLREHPQCTVLRVASWQVPHPRDGGLKQTGSVNSPTEINIIAKKI
mgnify:CR=1 FL=1